jgi:23S rRNA pseudouridine1911/1915/1917 synthase
MKLGKKVNIKKLILFEDNHLFVVNKPTGLSSLPNEGMEDIVTICKDYIKQRDDKKGNVFLHPAHRLDKGVSGILVMAKTSKALSRLNEQIRDKTWEKIYICELERPLPEESGELIHYLCKRKYYTDVYSTQQKDSKEAILEYKDLGEGFYEIKLKTGRYHQIRAQTAFMKSPIVGDKKYKAKTKRDRIHLHHYKLTFFHPVSKEKIILENFPSFMKKRKFK